jgi:large subunit ribosomal protein L32
MVNRMRATRAHRDNRRSHHALSDARLSKCANCGSLHRRHVMCVQCGFYKGKMVIDMKAAIDRKAKKSQEKEKALAR